MPKHSHPLPQYERSMTPVLDPVMYAYRPGETESTIITSVIHFHLVSCNLKTIMFTKEERDQKLSKSFQRLHNRILAELFFF
jgi:hypothetical protein